MLRMFGHLLDKLPILWGLDVIFRTAGVIGDLLGYGPKEVVFVVGTGRCGSSLLTRILRSHAQIAVFPGEANHLWHPALYPLQKLENNELGAEPIEVDPAGFTRKSVANWPFKHERRIRQVLKGYWLLTGRKRVLLVTSAMISHMVDALTAIFPGSKIVHLYRYGPSVVASYIKKNSDIYSRFNYGETEYLLYCADYWNACIIELDNVKRERGGGFLEVSYEDLCADPSSTASELADFMGIDPQRFAFDFDTVESRNWKVGDPTGVDDWRLAIEAMRPGLNAKRYL